MIFIPSNVVSVQMREAIQSKMRGKKEESETPTFMAVSKIYIVYWSAWSLTDSKLMTMLCRIEQSKMYYFD